MVVAAELKPLTDDIRAQAAPEKLEPAKEAELVKEKEGLGGLSMKE